jgi:SAM-dependent methyltransferase
LWDESQPSRNQYDWSLYLRIRRRPLLSKLAAVALSDERRAKMDSLPKNIVCHDLRQGIPYPDNSADVVYHSHIFEHLDRAYAGGFLLEIKRVLKPGGIHRIVVPDFDSWPRPI